MNSLLIDGSLWGAMWPHLQACVVSGMVSAGRVMMDGSPEISKSEWVIN